MAVPTYDKLMLPLLQYAGDGEEHYIHDAIKALADYLGLSEDDREDLLPSGKKRKFDDRVQWAKTYLKKAGLVDSTRRAYFQITERGFDVLKGNPTQLTTNDLKQFPEFVEFITPTPKDEASAVEIVDDSDEQTPEELISTTHRKLMRELADELLEYVLSSSPAFFERLVVDLLLAMGYGGSLDDAGRAIGRSGDEGIDGYIQEDKLGLDMIYIQAKRWARDNKVGRPDVQGFVGSLVGQGATKGVFITTSAFTDNAKSYAANIPNAKIILINGEQLAQLMIEHGVGVSVVKTYVIKQVDENYFPDIS